METTRQRIADALREEPRTASDLAATLSLPTPTIYEHLEHVSQSVADGGGADGDGAGSGDEEFLVAPPTCRECGFDGFDDPVNEPSRCPECKCERIEEPAFVIR
ncbi:transcriptional regulator [Halorubrum tebenquichense]|uniref:Putative transcriptional regulator containing an HTH domain fused to a Zn-ribbon n=1 Tax=Halorubrum tebenquichense DSM 14210 TaxID=1227485 RepID=M0DYC5_9EURY|nr:helix-turn-helix domain-containing protein [Halorubrum tebenquichense]ELZ39818.1 putative transcriptional regulator containing an HTH domain fused to a Zn-ribbon [Halorubrum tebenquichense DSM 14210]